METIYKYTIDPSSPGIEMPKGAEILTAAFQGESFCIWAKVDAEATTETRRFYVFGTGHVMHADLGINYKYIGTGFMRNGLVFHAFEGIGL